MSDNNDPFRIFENENVIVVTKEMLNDGKKRRYKGKLKVYGDFLTIEGTKSAVLLSRDDVLRLEVYRGGDMNVERSSGQSG